MFGNNRFARLDIEKTDIQFPCAPIQLDSTIKRILSTAQQTDIPTKKWDELFTEPDPECALIGTIEEERPLLWKEKRESGEIDLAGVHLGFSEIRVHGEYRI